MLTGEKSLVLERLVGKGMNYPVGDFLIRIKNAALSGKPEFEVVNTKLILLVAKALKKEGYLEKILKKDGSLSIRLAYRKKEPVLLDIRLVSKPGLRVYMGVSDLERIKKPSILLVSTSEGVMFSKEAIRKRLGGEVIAEVL
jgi:small subunit ribosomal protein S8